MDQLFYDISTIVQQMITIAIAIIITPIKSIGTDFRIFYIWQTWTDPDHATGIKMLLAREEKVYAKVQKEKRERDEHRDGRTKI